MRFGKLCRLRLRREFLAVQNEGRRLASGAMLVLVRPNGLGRARLGVTASRRVGNAVFRNRFKRVAREAFREVSEGLPGVDLVVIARSGKKAELDDLRRVMSECRSRLAAREGR